MRNKADQKRKSPLFVIFLTVLIDLIGFGLIIPLLPFYAQEFGAGALLIGGLTAAYSVMQLIFTPILGTLSDRIGRRPVLLVMILVNAVGFAVGGIGGALWVLYLGRAIGGIGSSTLGVAQAYIADITPPEDRAKGMGLIGAAFGLGFVIGPALGGTLGGINQSLPFFVAAGLSLINFGLAWFILPESLPEDSRQAAMERRARQGNLFQRLQMGLTRRELRRPVLIFFLFNLAFTAFEIALPLFTQRIYNYSSLENGYLFTYIGILVVIMQGGLIGIIVKRLGERVTLQIGLAILTVTVFLFIVPNWLFMLLVLTILAIGEGTATPTSSAIISLSAGADEQGEILGVTQATGSLARILGPLWGGFFFEFWGTNAPFIGATVLLALACVLAFGLRPVARQVTVDG
jgi:MFS transporter, DHA1 family, tetracycline resistance protein